MLITDPRDLLLGPDNDLVVTNDLQFSRGIQGVIQECRVKLQLFKGEWFLNIDAGIDYWGDILGRKPRIAIQAAQEAFTAKLEGVEDVIKVTKMTLAYNGRTRKLDIAWSVYSRFGNTPVDYLALPIS